MSANRISLSCSVAALSFTLGACSNEASNDTDGLWTANPDRFGPISANTAFEQQALSDALPGFEVMAATGMAEGTSYPIFEARHTGSDDVVLVIDGHDGRVLAVTVRTPDLVLAAADIGETAASGGFSVDDCFPGLEERSGDIVCQDPRPTGLTYWINVQHDGPDGELPPVERLNAGLVYEIQWVPVPT